MTEKQKLIIAMMQMNNLTHLLEGNQSQQYLYRSLIQLHAELNRQLKHYE